MLLDKTAVLRDGSHASCSRRIWRRRRTLPDCRAIGGRRRIAEVAGATRSQAPTLINHRLAYPTAASKA
jgi:hypothetical protein